MLACWQEDAGCRPTFSTLKGKFNQILLSKGSSNYVDFTVDPKKDYYNTEDEERGSHLMPSSVVANSNLTIPNQRSYTAQTLQEAVSPLHGGCGQAKNKPNLSLSAERIQKGDRNPTNERPSSMFLQAHSRAPETCRRSAEPPPTSPSGGNDRYVREPKLLLPHIRYSVSEEVVRQNMESCEMKANSDQI